MIRFYNIYIFIILFCLSNTAMTQSSRETFYKTQLTNKTFVIKGNSYKLLKDITAVNMGYNSLSKIQKELNSLKRKTLDKDFFVEKKGPYFIHNHTNKTTASFLSQTKSLRKEKEKEHPVLYDTINKNIVIAKSIVIRVKSDKEIDLIEKKFKVILKTKFLHLKKGIFEAKNSLDIIKIFEQLKEDASYKDSYLLVYDYLFKKR